MYVRAYDGGSEAHQGLERYLDVLQPKKPALGLDDHTPDGVYFENLPALPTTA